MEPVIKADRIVLHIGAHRTGTGNFQEFLYKNTDVLYKMNISARYPGRDFDGDGNLKLKLPHAEEIRANGVSENHVEKARRQLLKGPTEGELIISEENLLGRMLPIFNGKFYNRLVPRMGILTQALGRAPDQVVMVVRNYGDFFVSCYAQMAQVRVLPDWDTCFERLMRDGRTWVDVAGAVQKGLNPTRVTVVPYASRGTNTELLARMTKTKVDGLEEPPRGTNVSATTEAIAELQKRLSAKEDLTWPQVHQIKDDHSVANGGTAFSPLTPAQKSSFTRRYNADLAILKEDTRFDYQD